MCEFLGYDECTRADPQGASARIAVSHSSTLVAETEPRLKFRCDWPSGLARRKFFHRVGTLFLQKVATLTRAGISAESAVRRIGGRRPKDRRATASRLELVEVAVELLHAGLEARNQLR